MVLASPALAAGLPCSWLELALAVQPEANLGADARQGPWLEALLARVFPLLDDEGRGPVREMVEQIYAERPPVWRSLGILPG
jgi:hypothetical protein